jgi:hypothetical protein
LRKEILSVEFLLPCINIIRYSPNEKLYIPSIKKVWEFRIALLKSYNTIRADISIFFRSKNLIATFHIYK